MNEYPHCISRMGYSNLEQEMVSNHDTYHFQTCMIKIFNFKMSYMINDTVLFFKHLYRYSLKVISLKLISLKVILKLR